MIRAKKQFKIFYYALMVMIAALSFNACSKDDPDYIFTFVAPLDGAQAIPANSTAGSGYCNATYDSVSNQFSYTITWEDLSGAPTAINFQVPISGGGFTNITVTGYPSEINSGVSGYLDINQADEPALLSENFFVNINSATYGDGEIRGQLKKSQ